MIIEEADKPPTTARAIAAWSSWQYPFVERVIGSIRRECTDYMIPLSERLLLGTVREYVAYYIESPTHDSLDGTPTSARRVEQKGEETRGGVHHAS